MDAIAADPKTHCWLADKASFLLHGFDLPRIPADAFSVINEMREYPIWDPTRTRTATSVTRGSGRSARGSRRSVGRSKKERPRNAMRSRKHGHACCAKSGASDVPS